MKNQGVRKEIPTDFAASELRELARSVRRIHDPFRTDPERVAIAKDEIAARLFRLAEVMEAAG